MLEAAELVKLRERLRVGIQSRVQDAEQRVEQLNSKEKEDVVEDKDREKLETDLVMRHAFSHTYSKCW